MAVLSGNKNVVKYRIKPKHAETLANFIYAQNKKIHNNLIE